MDEPMQATGKAAPAARSRRRLGPSRWAAGLAVAAGVTLAFPAVAHTQEVEAPERCAKIDFDKAAVTTIPTTGTTVRHRLTVSGTKPWLDMQVRLEPLVYVMQPEFWGIEVVGCQTGDVGLPAIAPYTATYDFDGALGTRGIEVIGATRTQRIDLTAKTSRAPLAGTSWVLDPASLGVPVPEGKTITAEFSETTVGGGAACNLYSGPYKAGPGHRIRIGAIITTKIACDEGTAAAESAYLKKLAAASMYSLRGEHLVLSGPAGSLRFRRAPAELVGSWDVTGYRAGTPGAIVPLAPGTTISLTVEADGDLRGNGGCNEYEAPYTVNGSNISIGDITSTLKLCEEPVGSQEANYFNALRSAASWSVKGGELVLSDVEGNVVVTAKAA